MNVLVNTVKTASCKITRLLYVFKVALDGFEVVVGCLPVTGETVVPVEVPVVGFNVGSSAISGSFSPYSVVHELIPTE